MPHFRNIQNFSAILICLAVIPVAVATAGVGMPTGEYSMAYQGPETLTLYVVPDGSGDSFDQASLPYGSQEDATITLFLKDAGDQPIANFPREDMWLESRDSGLMMCRAGTIADANTDALGMTQWRNPLHAGGHSQALTDVFVNGSTLELADGLSLSFNSPDINGDLVVNLTDVQQFSSDFFDNVFYFRSDFHRDEIINLSDVGKLAYALGANCP